MLKLRKDGESNYETLEEALYHLRIAYADLLGHYAYEGLKGMELIKKAHGKARQACDEVV